MKNDDVKGKFARLNLMVWAENEEVLEAIIEYAKNIGGDIAKANIETLVAEPITIH